MQEQKQFYGRQSNSIRRLILCRSIRDHDDFSFLNQTVSKYQPDWQVIVPELTKQQNFRRVVLEIRTDDPMMKVQDPASVSRNSDRLLGFREAFVVGVKPEGDRWLRSFPKQFGKPQTERSMQTKTKLDFQSSSSTLGQQNCPKTGLF